MKKLVSIVLLILLIHHTITTAEESHPVVHAIDNVLAGDNLASALAKALPNGNFNFLTVAKDASIQGDLTVGGSISGTSIDLNTTNHAVQIGNASQGIKSIAVGTNGQILVGSSSNDPKFATLGTSNGITKTGGAGTLSIAGVNATTTQRGVVQLATPAEVMAGVNATDPVAPSTLAAKLGAQTNNGVLIGAGSTAALAATSAGTNGQLLIGATGAAPAFATLTSSTILFTPGPNSLNLEAVGTGGTINFNTDSGTATQSGGAITIAGGNNITTSGSGATVTIDVAGTTDHAVQVGNGSGSLTSLAVGTTGQLLVGMTGANPAFTTNPTLVGSLTLPAGSTASPSLKFTGSTNTGVTAATANKISLCTNGAEGLNVDSSGNVSINNLTSTGIVHNNASGLLSTSLIVNNDITNNTIANAKLATVASTNTPGALVVRDGSGDFTAGTITASLTGNATTATNATNFTGSLSGDVSGTQSATVVDTVGGQTAADIATATVAANAATPTNTAGTIVERNGGGNFSAGTITANLTGNVTGNLTGNASTATTATTATNFSGSLSGDVTGTQSATVVSSVGGQTAANVAAATVLANAATSANTASAIVRRDASGNFSAGTITAALTGNVTGNLTGNASTATSATTATTATNFSGSLTGDVTGTQSATVVSTVGGQTAANVAAATVLANAATANDTASTIVRRDSSRNFVTNMITINGTPSTDTDVATKGYVDNAIATGFTVKDPAVVVSTTNVTLLGFQIIDGVLLINDDRVLLVGQTDPVENGLWVAHFGAWTRPTDFDTGQTAGAAYVLITMGTVYAGTSWVCSTPTAVIGTDPITFAQFSLASQTTAANVGTGAGQIFRDKTGNTLNLKTLAAATHMAITNNANDITLGTDATDANTVSTIVARDGSGNFSAGTITAALTGSASNNVLKAGDTMTGTLNMATQNAVRFQDTAGGEYIGVRAPTTVGTSYTVDLPSSAPTSGQYLQASSATATQWTTIGGSPSSGKMIYVSKAGSDSNDGSAAAPYLTVKQAITTANSIASAVNPVTINVGAGIFTEDNSGGPITISANRISLVGSSTIGTVIVPNTLSNNLFNVTTANVEFDNFSLDAGAAGSTATAINLTASATATGGFRQIGITRFNTGLSLSASAGSPLFIVENILTRGNATALAVSNVQVSLNNSSFFGPTSGSTPSNTAVSVTGSSTLITIIACPFRLMNNAITNSGGAQTRINGSNFSGCNNGIVASGASFTTVVGCNFVLNNSGSKNISLSGAGTDAHVVGCQFACADSTATPQGTALEVTTGASMLANACTIEDAVTGLQAGTSGDTSTTALRASGVIVRNCTNNIVQDGTATLAFTSGFFDIHASTINDPTNVSFAAFEETNGNALLSIGDATDMPQTLYRVLNDQEDFPTLDYESDYYGNKGTVYKNPNGDPTFNGTQATSNNASYYVITGDRTKTTSINLISDTGDIGVSDNVRGWEIKKTGVAANLESIYSNNDTSGQAARGANAVMTLNGFDNQVEFPTATNTPLPTNTHAKLVWAGDTNLYRQAAGTLKTDGNLTVAGVTASRALTTNGSSTLTASTTTDTELGYLSGTTSSVQTQIDGKVAKSGDTMTGTLTLTPSSGNALTATGVSGSATIAVTPDTSSKGITVATTSGNALEVNTNKFTVVGDTGNTLVGGTLNVTGNTTISGVTAHGVVLGNSPLNSTSVGTTGQVLTGSTGTDPAFAALGTNSGLTNRGVLLGQNNSAIVATTAATNGQVLVGSTAGNPAFATLTSTGGTITYTTGANSLNIDGTSATTTQIGSVALATNAETIAGTNTTKAVTPDDVKAKLGTQTNHGVLVGAGTAAAVTALAVGSNGQVLIGSTGADPAFATLTSSGFTSTNSIQFTTGANSLALKANPVFGNVIIVDAVNGSDAVGAGAINGPPCATITRALTLATSGTQVFIEPGTYNESITIPSGVSVRGISSSSVTISRTNPGAATDLVTMGTNSRLENVNLSLTNNTNHQLRGIVFPSTTAASASVVGCTLTVDNTAAGAVTPNVYGVHSTGTGTPALNQFALDNVIIKVASAGGGNKRGILLDTAAHNFNIRNTTVVVTNTASVGIGLESNFTGISCNVTGSTLSAPTADISQTLGTLTLATTNLVNSTANGLGFSVNQAPSVLFWAIDGNVPAGTSLFMRPGTVTAGNINTTEIFLRLASKVIMRALTVRSTAMGGTTDTFTVRKNGVDTALAVSLTNPATSATKSDVSVTFAAGDDISIKVARGNAGDANPNVSVELY